jgi:hypothetical protein
MAYLGLFYEIRLFPAFKSHERDVFDDINRKEVDRMAEKEVKPKAKGKPKKKANDLAAKVLVVMKTLQENGVLETNSTFLRDKLKTKNRGAIRQVMRGLEKAGKVVKVDKPVGKRRQFVYRLA